MTDNRLLPAGYYESLLDWVECCAADKTGILDEIYPPIPVPRVVKEEELQLLVNKPRFSNKAFVVCIPNGRVLGAEAVISPDNKLIWDVSVEWAKWPAEHSIFQKKVLPPLKKTDQTVAVLNHPAAHNYYHWMLEVLARIHLVQESRFKADRYILNHDSTPYQLATLAACGVTPDKIIQPNSNFHLQAKNLIVPSYVHLPNLWSVNYVRNKFLSHRNIIKPVGPKRIYIRRRFRRRVTNEAEILNAIDKYGFKVITLETLPFQKQLEVFFNAQVIISPHGAGLANLVFCKSGTAVIELFSPSFMEPHYWLISRLLQYNYHFIVGKRENPHHYWSGFDDISINPDQLIKVLKGDLP